MKNLYSLNSEEIIEMCQELLFDKKDTKILLHIIVDELCIKQIANEINTSEQTVCRRIRTIKNKLKINKWTDNLL